MDLSAADSKHVVFSSKRLANIGVYVVLLIAYGLAISPVLVWIFNELNTETSLFILIAASLGVIALVWRLGLPIELPPISALVLILISGFISVWTFAILQQLSASFALMGAYGFFAGLARVSPAFWRKGLVMAGLAALALPFALVPGTGMGFYLRLITADASAQLLALIGHTSLGAHDVLIFDNGIAQVDLPCSGLKSLFTGTGFFFVASLLLRREVNFKWLLGYSIFAGMLIVANTLRVTVLIWVSEILLQRGIAEAVHMPLGLMLFCTVCFCGVLILYKMKPFQSEQPEGTATANSEVVRYGLGIIISAFLFAMFLFTPQTVDVSHEALTLPDNLNVESIALTPTETRFFGARERTSAGKWMFEYQNFSGSMLVVRSGAANGLHAPEVCLIGNGISVDHMETRDLKGGTYRHLTVDNGRRNAVYWMQSERTITDDFRKRLSNYVFGGQDDWVMVTLLFDERLNLSSSSDDETNLKSLMRELQTHYTNDIIRK